MLVSLTYLSWLSVQVSDLSLVSMLPQDLALNLCPYPSSANVAGTQMSVNKLT